VDPTIGWFLLMAVATLMCLRLGYLIGRRGMEQARAVTVVCMLLLMTWGWLTHCPSLATRLAPVWLLAYVEGTAPIPVYMAMVGALWASAAAPRQRRLAALATVLGVVYFLIGGMWMVQSTPQAAFAMRQDGPVVRQSQEYSCVAAACATALNQSGVPTTEARMAELTRTRPGTGSTLIRALDGLGRRLNETGSELSARMLTLKADALADTAMPVITSMRMTPTSRHMVTILDFTPKSVTLADPELGKLVISPSQFERYYMGEVIVFERRY
jgi:predicted double-glycine peptidase